MSISDLPVSQLPASDRPREKLIASGPRALSDIELIAVLFGTGTRGQSALQLSWELLRHFGSLRGLLSAELEKCLEIPGIGLARYCLLQAVLELARRHYLEALRDRTLMTAPAALRTFLVAQLRDMPYEAFCCLLLDTRHRLIAFEELFRGTIDGASVHPREVVRLAMWRNAAAVVFAHNHPSGIAEPSVADELITRRLKEALGLIDVRVLDHLIVGDTHCISLAERGLL